MVHRHPHVGHLGSIYKQGSVSEKEQSLNGQADVGMHAFGPMTRDVERFIPLYLQEILYTFCISSLTGSSRTVGASQCRMRISRR